MSDGSPAHKSMNAPQAVRGCNFIQISPSPFICSRKTGHTLISLTWHTVTIVSKYETSCSHYVLSRQSNTEGCDGSPVGRTIKTGGRFWFASASLANPYCQSTWMCVCLYVCMSVCLSEFLRSNISETKGARGSVTTGSL